MTLWVYEKKPPAWKWLQLCRMKGTWAPWVLLDLRVDPDTVKDQRPDFRGLMEKQEKREEEINGEKKF